VGVRQGSIFLRLPPLPSLGRKNSGNKNQEKMEKIKKKEEKHYLIGKEIFWTNNGGN